MSFPINYDYITLLNTMNPVDDYDEEEFEEAFDDFDEDMDIWTVDIGYDMV